MKTLKKTLSLTLVFALVFSLMSMAFAAETTTTTAAKLSDFTDKDQLTYTEAVDVMTNIGVINGYTDGSFKPTGTITREEAAKMVTYAILGPTVASKLSVTATGFKDVAADRWSAPYIAYCVSKGIINGMGDGTFVPTANVTGYQMAKMMLCAAGYGAKGEFTGAGWELAVAVTGNKAGVFEGAASVDFSKPATREEAALYTFNGIRIGQVVYNDVFHTYLGKGQGIGATDAQGPSIMAEVYTNLVPVYATVKNTANTISAFNGQDAFGNPANEWRLKTVDLGAYAIKPTFVYTSDKSGTTGTAAIEKELKSYGYKNTSPANFTESAGALCFVNGKQVSNITKASDIAALTGNGRIVNVYVLNGNIERVVVETPYLAKVTYVDTKNETVTVSVATSKDTYASTGAVLTTTLGYGTVKVDDYVVVYPVDKNLDGAIAGDSIGVLYPATVVTGKATQKSVTDKTITISGKAYEQGFGVGSATDVAAFGITDASDATLLLDNNGYFLAAVSGTSVTSDKIIAVTKNYQTLKNNVITNMVRGYNSKGEVVDYALYAVDGDKSGTITGTEATTDRPIVGGVYAFEAQTGVNSGTYLFTPINAAADSDVAANKTIAAGASQFTKATKAVVSGGNTYYFASDVKFIFADAGHSKVTVANGAQVVDTGSIVTYCLKDLGGRKEVIAVFAQQAATASANAASELYFFGETNGTKVVNGKTYNVYSVAKDGMPVDNCYGENTYYPGFYLAEIDKDTGAYTFSAYSDTTGLSTTNNAASPTAPFDSNESVVRGFNTARTAFTIGSVVLNTTNAKFICLAPKGLGNATDLANLVTECNLGQHPGKYVVAFAIYDDTTGIASHVYYKLTDAMGVVTAPADANMINENEVSAATVTLPAEITAMTTPVAVGQEITYTVTYTTLAADTHNATITFNVPTGTTLKAGQSATVSVPSSTAASTTNTATFTVVVNAPSNNASGFVVGAASVTVTDVVK